MITGYVYPYGYTGLTNGSEVWNCETGEKITDINTFSFNWASDSADVVNRCYLFGDMETTNRCYMYNPRLDLVDGKEPSITNMLGITAITNISSSAKDALAIGIGYTNYAAMNTEALAGRTVIVGGKINTNLLEANVILANALSAGTITAGTAIIDGLKATNANITGTLTTFLLYTPFKSITSNNYTINPLVDGNCICIKPSSINYTPILTLPDASSWDGLRIYIKVVRLTSIGDIAFSFSTNIQSGGFNFSKDGNPIGGYGDTTTSLFPMPGVYEFVAMDNKWMAVNYPVSNVYDVGELFLTSLTSFNITSQSTVVSKSTTQCDIYLPTNPFIGQCVEIFRRNAVVIVHSTNSKVIWQAGGSSSLIQLGATGDSARFKYDGEMWDCIYYSI